MGVSGEWIAHGLLLLAILVTSAGALIIVVNFNLRHTGEVYSGTPLDAPLWVGMVLLPLGVMILYVAKKIGVKFDVYPPDKGIF